MTILQEALPCPFCGKQHTLQVISGQELMGEDQEFWQHSESFGVVCDASTPGGKGGCGAMGGFKPTEDEAIEAWNTRTALAQQELPQKERTDFMAGYDAGMADAKRMAQQGEQAKPAAYITDTEQGPMVWTPEMYDEACTYCDDGEFPVPLYTAAPAPQAHECTRSHPHELMDGYCELRTEIARLTNENARLKAASQAQEPVLGTKTWFDGEKVITQNLTASDIYAEPAPQTAPVAWVWNPASIEWEKVRAFGHWQQGALYAFGPTQPEPLATPAPQAQDKSDNYLSGYCTGRTDLLKEQSAQPVAQPLSDSEIEKLREKTFSTNNPYCPVDSKSMRKAVRAAEAAHGIGEVK